MHVFFLYSKRKELPHHPDVVSGLSPQPLGQVGRFSHLVADV